MSRATKEGQPVTTLDLTPRPHVISARPATADHDDDVRLTGYVDGVGSNAQTIGVAPVNLRPRHEPGVDIGAKTLRGSKDLQRAERVHFIESIKDSDVDTHPQEMPITTPTSQ